MAYRYLALIGVPSFDTAGDQMAAIQLMLLERAGLERRSAGLAGIQLFASTDTPTMHTPCGGILIGHVFDRGGLLVGSSSLLPQEVEPAAFRAALTQQFWGEYVLLQSTATAGGEAVVSRDPSGGVQCLYAPAATNHFFTSDINLAVDLGLCEREVDWEFVSQFLVYPFQKTERTGLRGVRELLPGCHVHLRGSTHTIGQNWSPWDFVSPKHPVPRFEEATAEVRRVVESVVNSWTQIDHSILLELSGGLDSSIIAACLRKSSARVVCVTLVSALPGADERQYAGAIAERAGLRLRAEPLTVERARIDAPVPPALITPRAGPLQLAADEIMRDVAREEGLEAFYSGGGGDTVFSYLSSAAPAADAFIKSHPIAGLRAISDLSDLHQCTLWKAARLALRKVRSRKPMTAATDLSFLAPQISVAPPEAHPWSAFALNRAPGDIERVMGLAGTQVFRDGIPRGANHRLRLPLLSQPVMEACLAVPSWMWIAGGSNRAVARAAFADVLPANVLNRKSKGDFIQYCAAVYRHGREYMRELLLDGELASSDLLDVDKLQAFFDRPPSARDQTFMRIFDLCTIESWIRQQP